MAKTKRRDKSRVVLRTGESQRADGTYHYCWTDANRKRRYVYAIIFPPKPFPLYPYKRRTFL